MSAAPSATPHAGDADDYRQGDSRRPPRSGETTVWVPMLVSDQHSP